MNSLTSARRPAWKSAIALFAVLLFATACSAGSEEVSSSADADISADGETADDSPEVEEESVTEPEAESGGGDFDCTTMEKHLSVVRNASAFIPNITDQEILEALGFNADDVLAAIEGLRPVQDIEGIFGSGREGLDNMVTDVESLDAGDFGDKVFDYNVIAITAVVADEVCG